MRMTEISKRVWLVQATDDGLCMQGGKLDDITVVTAVVKEEQVQPKEQEESALQAQASSEIQPQASSETNRTPEL